MAAKDLDQAMKVHIWQEVERTSFLSGDGQDILGSSIGHASDEDFSGDSDMENLGRAHSGAAASSSAPSTSVAERHGLVVNSLKNSLAVASFYKLRCEVRPLKLEGFLKYLLNSVFYA